MEGRLLQGVNSESGGLSESHQTNYPADAAGLQAVQGPTLQRTNNDYGTVLLTKPKILKAYRPDLSFPGREPRGAIDVDLNIGGEAVRVIVTQLGLRPAQRRFQIRQILTMLPEERTRIVIMMCDFNEWLPVGRPLALAPGPPGKDNGIAHVSLLLSAVRS